MLNLYPPNYVWHDWSVDVDFDSATEMVTWNMFPEIGLPLIRGEWVRIQNVIDLDNDTQNFYYGDTLLATFTWTSVWEPGGALNIAAVDLYGNMASPVYYDDFSLEPGVVATEQASWSQVKQMYRP